MSEQLLRQMSKDISEMKEKITSLEGSMEEISIDMHDANPEYVKKLEKIDNEGSVSKSTIEKKFGVKL